MLFRSLFLDDDPAGGGGSTSTAAEPTLKVSYQGNEIEVPRPKGVFLEAEVNEKYVPKGAHNDQMARLRRDLDARKDLKPAETYLDDPDFKKKAVEKWGLDPNATSEQFQQQLARQKGEIFERDVKPLTEKLTKAEQRIADLQVKQLEASILAGAQGKVDPKYLKPVSKSGKALVVALLKDAFKYDPENDAWFAKGTSETAPFLFSQSGESPYMGPAEFIGGWVNGEGKDWALAEKQRGPETGRTKDGEQVPGQSGNKLFVTEAQIRDVAGFKKLQARADREGLTMEKIG